MRMDFGVDDLPLFSGTPVSVTPLEIDRAGLAVGQLGFFKCGACRDTGRVEDKYCLCEAGTRARVQERTHKGA